MSALQGNNTQSISNAVTFAGVVLLHVLGLVWAAQQLSVSDPVITPPSVVGVLVAPEPEPAPPPPKPVPPPPKPEPKPVVPKPTPKPTPKPVAKPEPVREVAPEPVQQAAPAAPAPPAPPVQQATPAPEAPAPVTPPRTDAAHLNNPAPQYPALSRRLGEQGRVMLDVYILPDGSVGEIKLNRSSGFPRLDNAALQAVKTWKYVPAKRGDKPIPFWYVQPVSFVLNN
ncbi:MAG: energy transducer TonB [Sutterellaceae bacterium]|nr:energy transducer TonB [Sutterellaceae bacterium]